MLLNIAVILLAVRVPWREGCGRMTLPTWARQWTRCTRRSDRCDSGSGRHCYTDLTRGIEEHRWRQAEAGAVSTQHTHPYLLFYTFSSSAHRWLSCSTAHCMASGGRPMGRVPGDRTEHGIHAAGVFGMPESGPAGSVVHPTTGRPVLEQDHASCSDGAVWMGSKPVRG